MTGQDWDVAGRAPLNALRSFVSAARHLSFLEAARELGVTPSAVSVQIKRLEAAIGRPLFLRDHRAVRLSETGASLARKLDPVFLSLDRALVDVLQPVRQTLHITAMPSVATLWLAPRLARFAALRPEFPVRVLGDDALADMRTDQVDIGLRYGPGGYAPLHEEPLMEVEAFPVCSPAFARAHAAELAAPAGLIGLPLIQDETSLRSPDLPTWRLWLNAAGVEAPAGGGLRFDSLHMSVSAAVAGQGVALGISPLVDEALASGALVRPFDLSTPSPFRIWFVCRPERLRERKIRAFRDWIVAECASSKG